VQTIDSQVANDKYRALGHFTGKLERMNSYRSRSDPSLPEDLFAGTAEHYARYRIPYPAVLLEGLVASAKITGAGRLLDLGSGPGRVAVPMARFFDEVVAVDQEPEMIKVGLQQCERSGVRNVCWKLGRAEDFEASPGSFEMITIGEAFHRMDRPLVARRALEWLGPGKCIAVMGCNSVWKGKETWQLRAVEVLARWTKHGETGRRRARIRQRPSDRQILREAGFVNIRNRRFPTKHTWSIDSFIGYLYSTSVASRRVLGDNVEAFETDLRRELLGCDSSGCYGETVHFFYDLARRPERGEESCLRVVFGLD
jgi:2-polyprenyl-3-methyl-5-hydroxy-6-metoxy-1,4-benzoquinol methylase